MTHAGAGKHREALSRIVKVLMPGLGDGKFNIRIDELIEYMSALDESLISEAHDALSHREEDSSSPLRLGLVGSSRVQRSAVMQCALRLVEYVYSETSVLISLDLPSESLLSNCSGAGTKEWSYDALVQVVSRGLADA